MSDFFSQSRDGHLYTIAAVVLAILGLFLLVIFSMMSIGGLPQRAALLIVPLIAMDAFLIARVLGVCGPLLRKAGWLGVALISLAWLVLLAKLLALDFELDSLWFTTPILFYFIFALAISTLAFFTDRTGGAN